MVYILTNVHILQKCKQPKWLTTVEWLNYNVMEYYATTKNHNLKSI